MRRILPCILVLLCLTALGCESWTSVKGTARNSWKWTRATIDPNPEINVDVSGVEATDRSRLASLFTPLDMRLEELYRSMESQSSFPEDRWYRWLFGRYPWLDGALALDSSGATRSHKTAVNLKPLNFDPLLAHKDIWLNRKVRATVEVTELGPEMYVVNPLVRERTLEGLVVAYFDPRSLVQFSPQANDLLVVTPDVVLWPGSDAAAAQALANADWDATLRKDVDGTMALGGRTYTWVARHYGGLHLIYATANVAKQ